MAATLAPPLAMGAFEMKTALIFSFYLMLLALTAAAPAVVGGIVLIAWAWYSVMTWND
jgi:hypothetical protein